MRGIQGTSNKTYRQLMGNGLRYEIPKFQRDYTWDTEQWDDLWQDIKALMSNEDEEHYMGYLVLQTSNNKEFQIIDGQQRLTTMSILILSTLKCLNDLVDSNIDPESNQLRKNNLLNSYIGYIDPVTLISNNKLKLNRNSNDYYKQHLVLLKDLPLRNTNTSEKHMRECFNWYYDRIKKEYKTGEELAGFVDNIVDKLFFTVIEVTDQLNAFKVFETLNARGVQLSSSDLLKNHLFSVVDETQPHISEIEELENIWSKIVGKLGEQKFEDYLRYYWNSISKSVGKKNLFKTIKSSIKTKQEVFGLIRNLNDTADIFLAIQNPEDDLWRDKPEIQKALRELKLFQIRQTYSLFMSGYRNLTSEGFSKLTKTCSIISLRYNIIGGLNPNAQEDVYNAVALKIESQKKFLASDFQSIYVQDSSFENDFSTKEFKNTTRNHKIVKYLLAKIEIYEYNSEIDVDSDLFTIEHILPENADEEWGEFSFDEINRSRFRIGNLTLLEKKLNREAAQKSFTEKCKLFEKSQSKLTNSIPTKFSTWDEAKIATRQRMLAKHAKAVWKIQELSN
ncbi:DUF262 domain-containing HNH endonuclease family protein [Flectobacillus sp. DC10W]|jgi:uncharacterized protein with ParB-like and HNH nuclease domain|uniref:DUF262 domain-containing HNH endonuclease family protein n=1 Tax=Flectobacillus longus TaxID=2984207 RepID=A0ABT6YJT8_9BACT|nr:DUF262 domain-containing HNH endonuclease family protein [Flectobacillus longus]MDI9863841.1 DUF262 domain-containing HNH endonuclease family protein [Flectobacillus longus]